MSTTRRFPVFSKTIALAAVLIALVVALATVGGIVSERQGRLHEAERSVAASLASSQLVQGPMLLRECSETYEATHGDGKDRTTSIERTSYVAGAAPATLAIDADAAIEPRHRGIFVVNGYVLKARLVADFAHGLGPLPAPRHPGATLACDAPSLFVALGDTRGVRGATATIDGKPAAVLPGASAGAMQRGFRVAVGNATATQADPFKVQVALELVGTSSLDIAPVGATTRVDLKSDWPHPSFGGRFLPVDRDVSEQGFRATWRLNALATSAPQAAADGGVACGGERDGTDASTNRGGCVETFGVDFFDPVSAYTLSDRATKYGFLFIALTFVGVAGVEVMKRVRVHPIQYGLVGAALTIFFLLLVSLSEHLAFAVAYGIAAAACTLLLAFYAAFVLRSSRAGAVFGAGVAALYGVLYVLLQLEQTALLLGSLLLFAVLASIMAATRRIDWYAFFDRLRAEGSGRATA